MLVFIIVREGTWLFTKKQQVVCRGCINISIITDESLKKNVYHYGNRRFLKNINISQSSSWRKIYTHSIPVAGQSRSLQDCCKVSVDALCPLIWRHSWPPFEGAGLLQERVRVLVPYPHVTLQGWVLVHAPQLPLTATKQMFRKHVKLCVVECCMIGVTMVPV